MNTLNNPKTRTLLSLLVLACAFTATHTPPSKEPLPFSPSDTLLHFVGFFGLAVTFTWQGTGFRKPLGVAAGAGRYLFLMIYAFVDETTQPFFQRSFEWGDLGADALGALAGLGAGMLWLGWRRVRA